MTTYSSFYVEIDMPTTRVLLVDDEIDFTEVLAERLKTRGINVDVTSNGLEAISMAVENVYDAVVLDLSMPELDGIDTLKRMLQKNRDLQVILLTGLGTVKKSVDAMKSGAIDFLEKPPQIDELVAKIMEAKSTREQLSEQRMVDTLNSIMGNKGW
jgi:DNA-binding NtrC family response regulator